MTRPPILRYVGPVPYVRCFSRVRPDRPRKRAASGVRRKRGGRPASGSGIIALRDLATSRRIAAAGRRPRWRSTFAKGDGEDKGARFRHPRRAALTLATG